MEVKQLTQAISQDMFPGSYIEPKWSRLDQIKNAPYYAMRLILGATITHATRGNEQYVSMTFEGCEYVIHKDNFKLINELRKSFLSGFLLSRGLSLDIPLRYQPDYIIDGIQFLIEKAIQYLDVPLDKARMIWIRPDIGPCGEYRCRKPYLYMQNLFFGSQLSNSNGIQNHVDNFYSEHTEFSNLSSLNWFDAFVIHRAPAEKLLSIFQALKQQNKTLIFEYDDDIFNIPEWNHNVDRIDAVAQSRARIAIEISDLIVCSTEQLKEVSGFPERAMVGPNLVDLTEFGKSLKCDRKLQTKFKGYVPVKIDNKRYEYACSGKPLIKEITQEEYEPIKILWTGSNTHDKDLEQIVEPVVSIGKEYGIAVRFIFFGYCPSVFMEAELGAGNTKAKLVVKNCYNHFIQYVEPVRYSDYIKFVRSINPDFALCPLCDDPFNLSKSNLKVLELGALGIPCIVSDFGPYKEFEDRRDCLKVNIGNKANWLYSIISLICDANLRQDLGFNIRERVLSQHSWNTDSPNRQKWDAIFNRIHELVMEKREALESRMLNFSESTS